MTFAMCSVVCESQTRINGVGCKPHSSKQTEGGVDVCQLAALTESQSRHLCDSESTNVEHPECNALAVVARCCSACNRVSDRGANTAMNALTDGALGRKRSNRVAVKVPLSDPYEIAGEGLY